MIGGENVGYSGARVGFRQTGGAKPWSRRRDDGGRRGDLRPEEVVVIRSLYGAPLTCRW